MTDRVLMACAFHEAGHCVAAMLCGYEVASVALFDVHADGPMVERTARALYRKGRLD
jgi:hypothetical protein